MDNRPPHHQAKSSVDGFIPRTPENRHVGFNSTVRPNALHGVRSRRPGFRTPPPAHQPGASLSGFVPRQTSGQISDFRHPGSAAAPATREFGSPAAADTTARHAAHEAKPAKHRRGLRNIRWKKVAKRTSLALAVLLVLCGGWLGWKIIRDSSKVFGGGSNLLGFLSATKLDCENTGRCNILLAGNSVDDPNHQGAALTDSIMLVSIDVKNNTAFMLSIPRDLYVNIPGNGYGKINQAYPDGGMKLLDQVVSQDFGIPVNYNALIDYGAFRDAVNAVGGVSIDIQSSDPRGLYDPNTGLNLKNGQQELNGKQALALARSRGDGYGSYGFPDADFDRTQNQRDMLIALKNKIFTSSVLADPIKLGQVFDAIGNNVHTNLSTGNIRRLYDIFKNIKNSDIKSYGLNDVTFSGQQNVDLLQNYNTSDGEEALIPSTGIGNYDQLQAFMQQITSNNPILKEGATIAVLNGGNTTGLGAAEGKLLSKEGINVSTISNAPSPQATTTIIDNSSGKDPATLKALEAQFGSNVGSNKTIAADYPSATFIVVLGANQKMPQNQ